MSVLARVVKSWCVGNKILLVAYCDICVVVVHSDESVLAPARECT